MLNHFRRVERDSQQWRELARRDALTGLANRKAFTEAAQGMLARAQGDTVEGALLMLDLDGFKPINDTLGHATGDQVLIALARALESTARTTDVVARLGGDEFAGGRRQRAQEGDRLDVPWVGRIVILRDLLELLWRLQNQRDPMRVDPAATIQTARRRSTLRRRDGAGHDSSRAPLRCH